MKRPRPHDISTNGGDGQGQASTLIELGFVSEPVINIGYNGALPLYSECLARLMIDGNTLLKGADFIGDLEAVGAIALLDSSVLDLVLDTLAEDPDLTLGCNISPCTLSDHIAWREILFRIEERRSLAGRLVLEFTESSPLNTIQDVSRRLTDLKRLGCRIAVDDFGAGFALIENLAGIDVEWDIVKVDRSCFGVQHEGAIEAHGLIPAISLAHSLAPLVVVEGIETQEHLHRALAAGACYGQGWLLEKPVHERWTGMNERTSETFSSALKEGSEKRHERIGCDLNETTPRIENPADMSTADSMGNPGRPVGGTAT